MQYYTGVFFTILSGVCFGTLPIFGKFLYSSGADTETALFLRFSIASILLIVLSKVKGVTFPTGRTFFGLVLMGIFCYSIQSFCFFSALVYVPPGTVTTLLYLFPGIVTILSFFIFKTRIGFFEISAILFAITGTALIVGFKSDNIHILGFIFGIGAALAYSVYVIAGTVVIKDADALASTTIIITSASIVYGVIAVFKGVNLPQTIGGYGAAVGIAVISTALAIITFFEGLKRIGPVASSIFSTFEPVVTILLSIVLFSEELNRTKVFGIFLILTASFLISMGRKLKNN